MKRLIRLLFLENIKESLVKGDIVAKQRFHLFKMATLYALIIYTSFLVQISMVDAINVRVAILVTFLFIAISINYLFFSIHERQEIASIALLGLLYTLLHIVAYRSGGLRNSTMLYIPALIMLTYMLLGKKGGMVMAGLTLIHLALFYYFNWNTSWVNYDLLRNDPKIIDFDFFVTAVLGIVMVTIQASYIERTKNEVVEDIKNKNKAFLEVTERLQLATYAAKIGIWDYDIKNDQLVWDEEMYHIFGVSPDSFATNYESWQSAIHPADRKVQMEETRLALSGEKEFDSVYRIIWPDDSIHYIQVNGIVQRDSDGNAMRMIGANWDISHRVRNENKIRELNESLERKISERTKEMQAYVEQLELKNKNLRQFAFMVSHNLRAPIAKIQGLAYLFEHQSDNEDNNTVIKFISNEVDNLDHVINDMNAIITTGDAENVVKETVNFNTEFKSITKILEAQIRESKGRISSDFSSINEIVSVRTYIYSILYNLLSNAIKYRSQEAPLEVEVRTYLENGFVCIEVTDNGMGINMDKHREKIFDLYARIHNSSIPGKGIGLSMVKVQVETLGGRVELESELSKGSIFRIFLPVS